MARWNDWEKGASTNVVRKGAPMVLETFSPLSGTDMGVRFPFVLDGMHGKCNGESRIGVPAFRNRTQGFV